MVAVNILMKKGSENSNNPRDVSGIGISNGAKCNVYSVSDLYCYLKRNPEIKVYINGNSAHLFPVMALNGESYVRSSCTDDIIDSLMKLPRIKSVVMK